MNIDDALRQICAEHNLSSIGVNIWPDNQTEPVTVYAHWDGADTCASGHGLTVTSAIEAALHDANAKRSHAIAVPEMEVCAP